MPGQRLETSNAQHPSCPHRPSTAFRTSPSMCRCVALVNRPLCRAPGSRRHRLLNSRHLKPRPRPTQPPPCPFGGLPGAVPRVRRRRCHARRPWPAGGNRAGPRPVASRAGTRPTRRPPFLPRRGPGASVASQPSAPGATLEAAAPEAARPERADDRGPLPDSRRWTRRGLMAWLAVVRVVAVAIHVPSLPRSRAPNGVCHKLSGDSP